MKVLTIMMITVMVMIVVMIVTMTMMMMTIIMMTTMMMTTMMTLPPAQINGCHRPSKAGEIAYVTSLHQWQTDKCNKQTKTYK